MSGRSPSTVGTLVAVLLGPWIWATHFLVVYGAHASLCEAGNRLPIVDVSWLSVILWGSTAITWLLTVGHAAFPEYAHDLLHAGGSEQSFTKILARMLSGLSAVAVSFSAIAFTVMPYCADLR
ncbi:hypothetical protein [Aquibium oceanicum]|uniref:Uncharacterized protein n=1 Tax=Aquibium oceanicum TaxID=1670800 RepID=A0A1L3SZT5_9HYPH|nr:hypothetical protein [Aquibium oceanicum]APH74937.1 hypothetical protein BSQ44_25985 [Aquibium oceanicum]